MKYQVESIVEQLKEMLVSTKFKEEALRVYAIARRRGFQKEARIASSHVLSIRMCSILSQPLPEEFDYLNARDFQSLLVFHGGSRSRAAVALLDKETAQRVNEPLPYSGCSPNNFYKEFCKAAKEELGSRPTADVISSPHFMKGIIGSRPLAFFACGQAASNDEACHRCFQTCFNFVTYISQKIDALPSTLS
jgi:hypothetical protein